jgi:hypothetical protein
VWASPSHLSQSGVATLTHIKKKLYLQSTQTLRMDNPYFFQMSFFSTKCAPFLLKIGEDFNIDDYKGKNI